MKNKTVYTILILLCVIGFWLFENFYKPNSYTNSEKNNSSSKNSIATNLLPKSTTNSIVYHDYYMLSYNEKYEQAEWVMYNLKKEHLTKDHRKRPYFIEDHKVKSGSADWKNYKKSGYERGHLCPAGDRRFSKYAYDETFYTSNISPQKGKFNGGVWNRLEQKVRWWCKKYNDLYIITGGVLADDLDEIGYENVAVPKAFYKVVFRVEKEEVKVAAFLFPHKETQKPLKEFLVSIDDLEKETGINFFYNKSEKFQQKIASKVVSSNWKF